LTVVTLLPLILGLIWMSSCSTKFNQSLSEAPLDASAQSGEFQKSTTGAGNSVICLHQSNGEGWESCTPDDQPFLFEASSLVCEELDGSLSKIYDSGSASSGALSALLRVRIQTLYLQAQGPFAQNSSPDSLFALIAEESDPGCESVWINLEQNPWTIRDNIYSWTLTSNGIPLTSQAGSCATAANYISEIMPQTAPMLATLDMNNSANSMSIRIESSPICATILGRPASLLATFHATDRQFFAMRHNNDQDSLRELPGKRPK